jgi:hypothetical protein
MVEVIDEVVDCRLAKSSFTHSAPFGETIACCIIRHKA